MAVFPIEPRVTIQWAEGNLAKPTLSCWDENSSVLQNSKGRPLAQQQKGMTELPQRAGRRGMRVNVRPNHYFLLIICFSVHTVKHVKGQAKTKQNRRDLLLDLEQSCIAQNAWNDWKEDTQLRKWWLCCEVYPTTYLFSCLCGTWQPPS